MLNSHLADPEDYRYSFATTWFDANAALQREYVLSFYTKDSTFEMIDKKTKRPFLKRTPNPDVKLANLYPGATVVIMGRQLKIVDYQDPYTKQALLSRKERGFVLIRPEAYKNTGEIFGALAQVDLVVAQTKTVILSQAEALKLYDSHRSSPNFNNLVSSVVNKISVAVEVIGGHCIPQLVALVGDDNPERARATTPNTLRAYFGIDSDRNGVYYSRSDEIAMNNLGLIFGVPRQSTATLTNCTVGVVLPHAISNGHLPEILSLLLNCKAFYVTALELFQMEKQNAAEFYEVYQTVIPEFPTMVDELCNGPCVAVELIGAGHEKDVVSIFRDFVGPVDPVVAKKLRPESIRAKFGINKVRNGIHCTDLPEDGELESEYFFRLLQK